MATSTTPVREPLTTRTTSPSQGWDLLSYEQTLDPDLGLFEFDGDNGSGAWSKTAESIIERERMRKRLLTRPSKEDVRRPPVEMRVSGLEMWDGRVTEVDDEYFTAELVPHDGGLTVLADFRLEQLGDERELAPGDLIYVTVRSVMGRSGYPHLTSSLRLRRLGSWTGSEVQDIEEQARAKFAAFEKFVE